MVDSLYNLIYNAFFAGSSVISLELANDICSWLSVCGSVFLLALPFVVLFKVVTFICRIGR